MDANFILQAVTTVGFPIVACGAMGYFVKYTIDKNRQEIANLNEQHKEEMTQVTQALNNNTKALTELCELMRREG